MAEIEAGAKKIPAAHAGYMELGGAKKDAECAIVDVPGGISKERGCCDLYDPERGADEFRCGECIYVSGAGGGGWRRLGRKEGE